MQSGHNQRNNALAEHRSTASFGPQTTGPQTFLHQQHSVRGSNNVHSPASTSTSHNFQAQSVKGSGNGRHTRKVSELMTSSQRTEVAQNPAHIMSANPKLQSNKAASQIKANATAVAAGFNNFSRKPSDFSFASGSIQKGGMDSERKNPRVVSPGAYAGAQLTRLQKRGGSLNQVQNLNTEQSTGVQLTKPNAAMTSSQTLKCSSLESGILSQRGQPFAVATAQDFQSIEEMEDEYGTQMAPSEANYHQIDAHMATQSTNAKKYLGSTLTTNMNLQDIAVSQRTPQHVQHIVMQQSVPGTQTTLMPQLTNVTGTPSSQHRSLTHNSIYQPQTSQQPYPTTSQQRDSQMQNPLESMGATSSHSVTLFNLKLEQAARYAELCERRILDYQPDHPLPVREDHLGAVFATMDAASAKFSQNSPSMPPSVRHGQVNRFDAFADAGSVGSPRHVSNDGSPRALKQHVDSLHNKQHQLEHVLRQETLANEEQRNYIQILKNVIEQKLERDGLLELLKEASQRKREDFKRQQFLANQRCRASPSPDPAQDEQDAINLYVLLSDMKYQLDSKAKEVQRFIEQLKTQDEYTRQLLDENQQCQRELEMRNEEVGEMQNRYVTFEHQLSTLHKQKDELLDCVETQVNQISALRNDLSNEKSRSSVLEEQVHRISQQQPEMNIMRSESAGSHRQLMQQQVPMTNESPSHGETPEPLEPPQIISNNAAIQNNSGVDYQQNEMTVQSALMNGIDLSYSREVGTDVNQTMQLLTAQQQRQQALQEQIHITNQAAILAAQKSLTHKQSQQESVSSLQPGDTQSSKLVIEQYQKHLLLKDQDIMRLRSQIDQFSSDAFSRQQENDSLSFNRSQLQKRLELEQNRGNQQEEFRNKQLEQLKAMAQDEQRKAEELQLHYEAEIRKCQREINVIREEQNDRESELSQVQKTYERQMKELELKESQVESLRVQSHKDVAELRELKAQLEDTQLDAERMRKDRERRQDADLEAGKTKEQLQREKHDAMSEQNALQHKFDIFKTQKQTESHRSEQIVRDAQTRVDVLEKTSKHQIVENETLSRDYSQCAVKLKQCEVQVNYLESSNKQMTEELRQTKLDSDSMTRKNAHLESKINDLEAQIETLSVRDGRNKKLSLELNEAQLQMKTQDTEIEKLDSKMRKLYLQKEEFEVEAIQLRKNVHEMQLVKNEFTSQKEILSGQTKDNERRIFELIKEKQDGEKKLRENVIVIHAIVEERDKYKHLVSDREDEIVDLGQKVKTWRSANTDLKLIEEKVDVFLSDVKQVLKEYRHTARPVLQEFLRHVKASEKLSKKVTMRQREIGYAHLDKIAGFDVIKDQQTFEGDHTHQSQIWQSMLGVKEMVETQSDLHSFVSEMLEVFVAESIELNSQVTHASHKVNNLEKKLGTIHSVDFKAQSDSQTLKKGMLDLEQKRLDDARKFQDELAFMQQSLEDKTRSEHDLQREMTTMKRSMGQSLAETNHQLGFNQTNSKKMVKELWSVTAEKNRFKDVLQKLQDTVLSGTRAEALVEDMKRCSYTLSVAEADKESLHHDIEDLEQRLANVNAQSKDKKQDDDNSSKITAIQRVKILRSELIVKEDRIRDLDERLSMEGDRMHVLSQELKALNQFSTSTLGAPTTNQPSNLVTGQPTATNRQRHSSASLNRQTQHTENQTPQQMTQDSTMKQTMRQTNYTTSQIPRYQQNEGGNSHRQETIELPQRDYYEYNEQRGSAISHRMRGFSREEQSAVQNMAVDTTLMSNTQELNTHNMAKLLMKEAANVPRRHGRDFDQNMPERGPPNQGSSTEQLQRIDSVSNRLPDHLYSQQIRSGVTSQMASVNQFQVGSTDQQHRYH